MFMITNLIEPRMGKLMLNHLIGKNCPEFLNGLLWDFVFSIITKIPVPFKREL